MSVSFILSPILEHFLFHVFRAYCVYIFNAVGDRQHPCVCPLVAINPIDTCFQICIFIILSLYDCWMHLVIAFFIFISSKVSHSISNGKLSHAWVKSISNTCKFLPVLIRFSVICFRQNRLSMQERPARNVLCTSDYYIFLRLFLAALFHTNDHMFEWPLSLCNFHIYLGHLLCV
jgi:hypothetical protein